MDSGCMIRRLVGGWINGWMKGCVDAWMDGDWKDNE